MSEQETTCRRKEPRFKASDDKTLLCEVFVDVDAPVSGHVIDISTNGLRLFCEGDFKAGSAFLTELKTDVLHGVFSGIIRRVTPWVGGGSVLGCQLLEPISEDVLEALAKEHIVNRRQDERVRWNQPAKMTWELGPGEVDVTIKDCSAGGLRLFSEVGVPMDTCVRLLLPGNDEKPITIDARPVWQKEHADGWGIGLSFIRREVPDSVVRILAEKNTSDEQESEAKFRFRQKAVIVAVAATFIGALIQIWAY